MIIIRMPDGVIFNAHEISLDAFTLLFQEGLKKNKVIEIEDSHGLKRMINPRQVLYFEENM